jgi:predicted metal-binding protein
MMEHVLFVCQSCAVSSTQKDYQGQRGGQYLLQALQRLSSPWHLHQVFRIEPVKCLSACNRPCVIALAAPGKSTLMFGDLSPFQSAAAVLQLAEQYYASPSGLVPRLERPRILQKGILASIPPLPVSSTS